MILGHVEVPDLHGPSGCERESKGVVGEREGGGGADHLRGLTLLINNLQRRDLLNCLLK